jgi:SagB-type dehydrogenase family enzyme
MPTKAAAFDDCGPTRPLYIRRASSLVCYWEDDEFTLENPLSGRRVVVTPGIVQLLDGIRTFVDREELERDIARALPNAGNVIDRLLEQDILVLEGSEVEQKDALLNKTWTWNHETRFFHYSSQHVAFAHDAAAQQYALEAKARSHPPPSPYKSYGGGLPLPGAFDEPTDGLWETLRLRRTRREFGDEPLPLGTFARLLLWTWGRTEERRDPALGSYILKTSPSGGARHPIEVYPLVLRVADLEPGLYHYSVELHQLERIRAGADPQRAAELCCGQPWVSAASALFFMTAIIERSMWKYEHGHAYRVVLLDAGHLGQTFQLVCTRLGVAPFTTAATDDQTIERELGIDGVTEVMIYTAAVGPRHPVESARGHYVGTSATNTGSGSAGTTTD